MVRHGLPDIGEPIAELLYLQVQPDLVVTHRFTLLDVGVEPTAPQEDVLENGLVATVDPNVLFRDHEHLGPPLQPEQVAQVVRKHPTRGLHVPLREYASCSTGYAGEHVKHRQEVAEETRVGNHVVIREVQDVAGGKLGPRIPSEVRTLSALIGVPDPALGLRLASLYDALRPVGRAVVDHDDLKAVGWIVQVEEALKGCLERLGTVVGWNDDRDRPWFLRCSTRPRRANRVAHPA